MTSKLLKNSNEIEVKTMITDWSYDKSYSAAMSQNVKTYPNLRIGFCKISIHVFRPKLLLHYLARPPTLKLWPIWCRSILSALSYSWQNVDEDSSISHQQKFCYLSSQHPTKRGITFFPLEFTSMSCFAFSSARRCRSSSSIIRFSISCFIASTRRVTCGKQLNNWRLRCK